MAIKNLPNTKEKLLEAFWKAIKGERSSLTEDPLEHAGNVYQVDLYSRESMVEAIEEMNDVEKISWRLLNNSTVELSKTQLRNILTKYRKRKLLLSSASWSVESDLEAMDLEDLDGSGENGAIDVLALYATKIQELEDAQ